MWQVPIIPRNQAVSRENIVIMDVGSCELQGRRPTMEDAICFGSVLRADLMRPTSIDNSERAQFFAVFDGHGGADVSALAASIMPL